MTRSSAFSQEPRRVGMGHLEEIYGSGGGRPTLPPSKKEPGGGDFAVRQFT
jgi:hypothetical protein